MSLINFAQGNRENYKAQEMQDTIYLSDNSKEILFNDQSYGNATPADEEDITAEDGNLKLRDRAYDADNFSGKGYKILRKNIQQVTVPKFDLTISTGCTANGNITINEISIEVTTEASTPEAVAQLIQSAISGTTISGAIITFTSNPTIDYSTTGVSGQVVDNSYQENRNVLTQSMINDTNTVYEIRYDFYIQATLYMREGSYFVYNGGTITSDGTKRIVPSANTVLDTRVTNPFIVDYSYSGSTILVNSPTELIGEKTNVIASAANLIVNDALNGDHTLYGMYTSSVYGTSRFKGTAKYNKNTLLRNIYLSEFIKNNDGTYNTINSIPDLTKIYTKIKNTFTRDVSCPKTIIIDVQEAIVTDTIQLDGTLNLLCPSRCILNLGDSYSNQEQRKNVFEFSNYSTTTRGFIDGFVLNIKANQYIDCFCKLKSGRNILDLKNIRIGYGRTDSDIEKNRPYNCIFKIDTEGYANGNPNPNSYCDFLTFYNVAGCHTTYGIDVIVGVGDCCSFEKCSKMNVFCVGGQKSFKECMHVNVMAINSVITIQNNHNEVGHYSFSQCDVSFQDCVIGNAIGNDDATILLNDTSLYNQAKELFDCTENQYFDNLQNRAATTYLKCVNTMFSFNENSECNGFKKNLYDIQSKDNNYKIALENSYRVSSWLDKLYCTQIYTNDLVPEVIFSSLKFDTPSFTIYYETDYSLSESWATYDSFQQYIEQMSSNPYSLTINNILVLFSVDRLIGQLLEVAYSKDNLSPTANTSFKCVGGTKLHPGNYIFNLAINQVQKHVIIPIIDTGINTDARCSSYQLLGRSYVDGNIENYNQCSKVELLSQNKLRAYLDELPKYGEWQVGDEVVLNSNPDNIYTYNGIEWVSQGWAIIE